MQENTRMASSDTSSDLIAVAGHLRTCPAVETGCELEEASCDVRVGHEGMLERKKVVHDGKNCIK